MLPTAIQVSVASGVTPVSVLAVNAALDAANYHGPRITTGNVSAVAPV